MVAQGELMKYVPLLNNQQQKALLVIVKSMVSERRQGEVSKLDIMLSQTSKGKPTSGLLKLASSIPTKEIDAMIDAIEDPIYGCGKIDYDEW
ncbi:MAG: hypothetical protein ACPGVB_01165 [Chitinophagales bacterium]